MHDVIVCKNEGVRLDCALDTLCALNNNSHNSALRIRTVPPQELTDAAHKAARLTDTDAHIQTASRSYTRALWYQSRVWDPDD